MTALQRSIAECSTSGRRAPVNLALKCRYSGRSNARLGLVVLRGVGSGADGLGRQSPRQQKSEEIPQIFPTTWAFTDSRPTAPPRPIRDTQQAGGSSSAGSPLGAGQDVSSTRDPGSAAALPRPPQPSSNGSQTSPHPRSAQSRAVSTQTSSSSGNGEGRQGTPAAEMAENVVAEALARAQDAISRAESSLEGIEELPSARPPSKLSAAFRLLRTGVIVSTLCLGLIGSQALGFGMQWASAIAAACGIAWWGLNRQALNMSGAVAALIVGAGTIGCSLRFGATLLGFFFSSSKLTAFKEELKDGLDDKSKSGGQRDWIQVMCNGGIPMAIAVAYGVLTNCVDVPLGPLPNVDPWRAKLATLLGGAFLGYYAACCGDTWASELGPLSSDTPRLITTLRPVRRGTNGGVTLLGLSASILGGVFVGAVFYAAAIVSPTLWILDGLQSMALSQWRLIPLGLMAGLMGSVLDSVLGATLQYTGFNRTSGRVTSKPGPDVTHISGISFLDNNMVNMVSATVTAGFTALAAMHMFGC